MVIGSRSRCNLRQICAVQPQRRAEFGRRIILSEIVLSNRGEAESLILNMRATQPKLGTGHMWASLGLASLTLPFPML
jgi:hypothetical protein